MLHKIFAYQTMYRYMLTLTLRQYHFTSNLGATYLILTSYLPPTHVPVVSCGFIYLFLIRPLHLLTLPIME